jgi:Zn-dependent protease/predicted transcriptional regulator
VRGQIRLVTLFGVELGLHYSWMVIAVLITFSLASNFRAVHPNWIPAVVWGCALLTGVLFFVCLFAHELSHAIVAKARGLPIHRITLFALGGMAQIEKEPTRASTEFWMGIVGPITSLVIGGVLLGIAWALGWPPRSTPATPVLAVLVWLGYINVMLAAFNMIPGFPLDGGRVLRAIIWAVTKQADRSTRIAARVGQFVGLAFIVYGVSEFFRGAGFNGLWLAFIGWFLLNAAGATYLQSRADNALRGVRVAQVMASECETVDGSIPVQDFVDQHLLSTGRRCFVVLNQGRAAGLITASEVRQLERSEWPQTSVQAVMKPLDRVHAVTPETPALRAMQIMAKEDVNQLPVVSGGDFRGIVTRAHILQLLHARSELGM